MPTTMETTPSTGDINVLVDFSKNAYEITTLEIWHVFHSFSDSFVLKTVVEGAFCTYFLVSFVICTSTFLLLHVLACVEVYGQLFIKVRVYSLTLHFWFHFSVKLELMQRIL